MDAGLADDSDTKPGRVDPLTLDNVRLAVRYAMRTEADLPAPVPDLSDVDGPAFAWAVRRHRVSICINPLLEAMGAPHDVSTAVRRLAQAEQMGAMRGVPALAEVVREFERRDLRFLVMKGTPLAVQTTGSLTSRGAGDIDLLIHPKDLAGAFEIVSGLGYARVPGSGPMTTSGAMWRYYQWATYEAPFRRGPDIIDLHWFPNRERTLLPNFDILWQRRATVTVGPTKVPTFGLVDAFRHSCVHAFKDRWNSLRSLVDVDRLARKLPAPAAPPRRGAVPLAGCVTFSLTGNPNVGAWASTDLRKCQRVMTMADQMQTEDFRPATYDWSPRGVMELMSSIGVGSPGVSDWARYVAYIALPMRLFNDPETGEDIGFRAVAGTRLREAGLKIRGTYDR